MSFVTLKRTISLNLLDPLRSDETSTRKRNEIPRADVVKSINQASTPSHAAIQDVRRQDMNSSQEYQCQRLEDHK